MPIVSNVGRVSSQSRTARAISLPTAATSLSVVALARFSGETHEYPRLPRLGRVVRKR